MLYAEKNDWMRKIYHIIVHGAQEACMYKILLCHR